MEKNMKKNIYMYVCVYIYKYIYILIYIDIHTHIYTFKLNHSAVQQKLTQHCKSTILQKFKKKEFELHRLISQFHPISCYLYI